MDDIKRNIFCNEKIDSNEISTGKGIVDTRLPLFGYTTETVNMLLTPMFQNK